MLCPLCDSHRPTFKQIEDHLVDIHGAQITVEKREFNSVEDFNSWKRKEEAETKMRYNTRSSCSKYNNNVFLCHRSGYHRKQGKQIKLRRIPTEKINRCCPARILTKVVGKTIKVTFHKTHFGHDYIIQLTEERRRKYEEMLKNKIKLEKIFKEVRSDAQIETEVRLRTILKRDEKYLKGVEPFSAYIPEKGKLSEWIVQQSGSLDNCVLCYKTDTESCFHCFSLFSQGTDVMDLADQNEFILILMTKRQRDEISTFHPKNVVLDTCRGEQGSYGVASLILIDEFGNACPVAFCIASDVNVKTIAHFFLTVKEAIGEISANLFMSNVDQQFVDCWIQAMGSVKRRLMCSWDVDRMWQSRLGKVIESREMCIIEVYHSCCLLLERASKEEFKERMDKMLDLSSGYAETRDFARYFKNNFANRPEQWALCYRSELNLKNFKLELLHKRLKYCQRAAGGMNRKIESCINKLLQIGDEMILFRLVQKIKRPTKSVDLIALCHEKSKAIPESMITSERENVWSVEIGSKKETVSFTPEIRCKCQPRCNICRKCFHQISCTCEAYLVRNEFCEHAHACIALEKKKKETGNEMFSDEKRKKLDELSSILDSFSDLSRQLNEEGRCTVYEEVKKLHQFIINLCGATSRD